MVTCYLRYIIDPLQARRVREVLPHDRAAAREIRRHRPRHVFLPHEGPNNVAVWLFSFPSLGEYERYRTAVKQDEVAVAAWRFAEETRYVVSFERSFMRPLPD